jgi:FkbM family methyltransferase
VGSLRKCIDILRAEHKPVLFIFSRLLWRSRICLLLKIRRDGYVIRFSPSIFGATMWLRPDERRAEERLLAHCLREGDCVVDVGANIGTIALTAASRVGPEGSVYAFEPHPRIFGYLIDNIKLNGFNNVRAFNLALGSCEGAVLFSDIRNDDQNAIIAGEKGITVPIHTLDAMHIVDPVIHLLKVDTEGYEKFVLLGASKLLEKTLAVYFECWDQTFARYGYQTQELLGLLKDTGFSIFKPVDGGLKAVSQEYVSSQLENLLALRGTSAFLALRAGAEHR